MSKKAKIIILGLVILLVVTLALVAISAEKEKVEKRAFLGVYLEDLCKEMKESINYQGEGVFVQDVVDDSPAEESGIKAGDVIVKFNDKKVTTASELKGLIKETKPGDSAKISVLRDGKEIPLTVKMGEAPEVEKRMIKIKEFGPWGKCLDKDICICAPECGKKCDKKRAFIGVNIDDMSAGLKEYFGVKSGTLVTEVMEESPAKKVGIKAGDVIVGIKTYAVEDASDLLHFMQKFAPGDKVDVKVIRRGETKTFNLELGKAPETSCGCPPHPGYMFEGKMKNLQIYPDNLEDIMEDYEHDVKAKAKKIKIEVEDEDDI
jgi:serine protease Do